VHVPQINRYVTNATQECCTPFSVLHENFGILRAISPRGIRVALDVLKRLCCWLLLLLLLLAALTDHSICADVQQTLHSTYSMFGESIHGYGGPLIERQRGSYPSVSEDADRNSRHQIFSEEAEINSRPSSHSPPSLEVLGPQPLYAINSFAVFLGMLCTATCLLKPGNFVELASSTPHDIKPFQRSVQKADFSMKTNNSACYSHVHRI
jgi:hypothetical protein